MLCTLPGIKPFPRIDRKENFISLFLGYVDLFFNDHYDFIEGTGNK